MKKRTTSLVLIIFMVLASLILTNNQVVKAQDTKTLNIQNTTTLNTSYYEPNNFEFELSNGTLMFNNIPDSLKNCSLWVRLYSESQGIEVFEKIYNPESTIRIDLTGYEDGTYRIYLYYQNGSSKYYNGYWWDAGAPKITISGTDYNFKLSEYYNEIETIHKSMVTYDYVLDYFKKPSDWVESDSKIIIEKAKEITKTATTDYERIYQVYEWVINNIYYDYDGLYGKSVIESSAIEVLKGKKAVCQGYADLTAALLRSLDIPTMLVAGNAASPIDKSNINHAWNMAYADGRWIFLDSTWDSHNRYENGEYITNEPNKNRMWFDMSLEMIANSHYVLVDVPEMVLEDLLDFNEYLDVDVTYGKVTMNPFPVDLSKIVLPDGYELVYKLSVGKSICSIDSNGIITFTGKGYDSFDIVLNVFLKHDNTTKEIGEKWISVNNGANLTSKKLSAKSLSTGKTYSFYIPGLKWLPSTVKYSIKYSSSDTKVASVSKKGVVKAKSKGKSTITAIVSVGTKKFTFKQEVVVKK